MVEATIAGISTSATKAVDDWAVRVPLPLAQQLLRVTGANTWTLLLDRTDATAATVESVRGRIPAERFEVVPWTELADFYNKTVALFSRQVSVVRVVIAVIIVLSIANSMMMTVMERTGEIGTSLALGVPRSRVLLPVPDAGRDARRGRRPRRRRDRRAFSATIITAVGIPMPAPPGSARGYIAGILLTPRLVAESLRARGGHEHARERLSRVEGVADADRRRLAPQPLTWPPTTSTGARLQVIRLALRNLARQRMRTGVTLAAIAFGVAALILTGGFVRGHLHPARRGADPFAVRPLQVAARGYFDGGHAHARAIPDPRPGSAARADRRDARRRRHARAAGFLRPPQQRPQRPRGSRRRRRAGRARRGWAPRCG